MSISQAVEVSVAAMAADGSLDLKRHAAPIEVLRVLAANADACDPSKDNVTIPTMLKCMTALGMMPGDKKPKAQSGAGSRMSLVDFKKRVPSLKASDG